MGQWLVADLSMMDVHFQPWMLLLVWFAFVWGASFKREGSVLPSAGSFWCCTALAQETLLNFGRNLTKPSFRPFRWSGRSAVRTAGRATRLGLIGHHYPTVGREDGD